MPVKFGGKTNPRDFLQIYVTAMRAASTDEAIMVNRFALALKDEALSWLCNLPAQSVKSWPDLCNQYLGAFQGAYKHPRTINDLHGMKQGENESLRDYI